LITRWFGGCAPGGPAAAVPALRLWLDLRQTATVGGGVKAFVVFGELKGERAKTAARVCAFPPGRHGPLVPR
jgi:hypothetical protein